MILFKRKDKRFDAYLSSYIEDMLSGKRLTLEGKRYSNSSIVALRQIQKLIGAYQKSISKVLLFDDINMDFYHDFSRFLNRSFSLNTIGKHFRSIKTIMACAQAEGRHQNNTYLDRRFKAPKTETDNIYLTHSELKQLKSLDLSNLSHCYEETRDVFFIGILTAQRISDYSSISKDNIVRKDGYTLIELFQKKTGGKITLPCPAELLRILEKYDYSPPHPWPQHMNKYLKVLGRMAGINTPVTIRIHRLGETIYKTIPKYQMIQTHTARRTGATLMYLAGMNVWDIMQITGHKSAEMLKKYIKASELEVAQTIQRRYPFYK